MYFGRPRAPGTSSTGQRAMYLAVFDLGAGLWCHPPLVCPAFEQGETVSKECKGPSRSRFARLAGVLKPVSFGTKRKLVIVSPFSETFGFFEGPRRSGKMFTCKVVARTGLCPCLQVINFWKQEGGRLPGTVPEDWCPGPRPL